MNKATPAPCHNARKNAAIPASWLAILVASAPLAGCASSPSKPDPAEGASRKTVARLEEKIAALEARLAAMDEKLDSSRVAIETRTETAPAPRKSALQETVTEHALPTEAVFPATPIAGSAIAAGREASSRALDDYRKARVLYEARKHTHAILAFNHFLENYPDHALAGNALYFIGESYYVEGDLKLALQEYRKLLTSYDRSPHAADALSRMSEIEGRLGLAADAETHRQMLLSLFPQSPAAATAMNPGSAAGHGGAPETGTPPPSAPLNGAPEPRSEGGLDLPPSGANELRDPPAGIPA